MSDEKSAGARLAEYSEPRRPNEESADRVSELDGALQFVDAMLEENARAVIALRERLTPVMQGERPSDPHALAVTADPRSDVVRKITEYGERLRDHTNLVKDALERLDV